MPKLTDFALILVTVTDKNKLFKKTVLTEERIGKAKKDRGKKDRVKKEAPLFTLSGCRPLQILQGEN